MQGMGKEWEGTIAKRGRAVFKETGRYSYVALLLLSRAAFGWLGTLLLLVGGSSYYVFGALALFATADRKSTRLNSSHYCASRMPSSACKKQTSTLNKADEHYCMR